MDNVILIFKDKMSKTLEILRSDLSSVKVGRANPSILDKIEVEYYGVMTKLNQIANISTPDSKMIVIQPWEKGILKDIEKSILKSDLGLVPNNDGTSIRLVIPEMTEETRRNTVKKVKKIAEDSKVVIRTIRREANDKVKSLKKDGTITEDDLKKLEEEIQKITDKYIKDIDFVIIAKEKEIMLI